MHVIYWYITYESKNIMIVESLVNQIHKIAQEVVEDRNIMKNEKEKERIPKYLYVKPLQVHFLGCSSPTPMNWVTCQKMRRQIQMMCFESNEIESKKKSKTYKIMKEL